MKALPLHAMLVLAIGALAGCGGAAAPDAGAHVPLDAVTLHRQARACFDQADYAACIRGFAVWLQRYDLPKSDLAASARFYTGLSWRKLGDRAKAADAFREVVRGCGTLPPDHPAAKWALWAQQELKSLE